ncbi:MAG TPA: hypothetical protein ENI64_08035 [Gammaproteobacteria bacterium]|nr:hypothetical protein [Gammaproteobacteria bacterium]
MFSNIFFKRPAVLNEQYPAIYDQLRQYYRQDTLLR